jgi:hypothetical protein
LKLPTFCVSYITDLVSIATKHSWKEWVKNYNFKYSLSSRADILGRNYLVLSDSSSYLEAYRAVFSESSIFIFVLREIEILHCSTCNIFWTWCDTCLSTETTLPYQGRIIYDSMRYVTCGVISFVKWVFICRVWNITKNYESQRMHLEDMCTHWTNPFQNLF